MILLSQFPKDQDYRCVPLSPSGRDHLCVCFILPWLAMYVPLVPAELDLEDDLRVCQLTQRGNYTQKKKENYLERHRIPKDYLWIGTWLWEELPKKWNKGWKQVCCWFCIPHLPTKALLRILLKVIFWKVVNYFVPWLQTHVTMLLLSIDGKHTLVLGECR